MIASVVLFARKPGGEWLVRNSRLSYHKYPNGNYVRTTEEAVAEGESQADGWRKVEPLTEFRVRALDYEAFKALGVS